MFKPIQAVAIGAGQPQPSMDEAGIKRVFMVLHGFYGNLFFTKYATGHVENGEDQGIANARRIWSYSLREYGEEDIKLALRRCQVAHTEYPPSLPQFLALCDAISPKRRGPVRQELPSQPRIEMSEEARERIREENRRKATEAAHKALQDNPPSGLDLLKQAIAQAVGDAGGDEAATLVQMDRILSPRRTA